MTKVDNEVGEDKNDCVAYGLTVADTILSTVGVSLIRTLCKDRRTEEADKGTTPTFKKTGKQTELAARNAKQTNGVFQREH